MSPKPNLYLDMREVRDGHVTVEQVVKGHPTETVVRVWNVWVKELGRCAWCYYLTENPVPDMESPEPSGESTEETHEPK